MWKGDALIVPSGAVWRLGGSYLSLLLGLLSFVAAIVRWDGVWVLLGIGLIGGGWLLYQGAMRVVDAANRNGDGGGKVSQFYGAVMVRPL